jgi:ubiquitin-protein ligase
LVKRQAGLTKPSQNKEYYVEALVTGPETSNFSEAETVNFDCSANYPIAVPMIHCCPNGHASFGEEAVQQRHLERFHPMDS